MSQRVINAWAVLLGVSGLLIVLALVLFGADLYRAGHTGPRWKRRILAAALTLLGAAGTYAAGPETRRAWSALTKGEPAAAPLAETAQWKELTATWREAEAVASGARGPYPFDEKGKAALLKAIDDRAADVDKLVAAGRLLDEEGGLLKSELARLREGVRGKRPTELSNAKCYKPMAVLPARDALGRLRDRLPLLEKLARSDRLHPAAGEKVLAAIEADLKTFAEGKELGTMTQAERQAAAETAEAAQRRVGDIRARVASRKLRERLAAAPRPAIADTKQWNAIVAAWRFAQPLAESHKSTTAQRKAADEKLSAAKDAVAALAKAGELSRAEAGLLTAEAETMRAEIYRDPPTDTRVKCYDMAHIPPARQSYERLQQRLPLLKALATSGKIAPAVCEKVLPTVRADLKALAAPDAAQHLGRDKQQAEQLSKQTHAALAEIDKLLAGTRSP